MRPQRTSVKRSVCCRWWQADRRRRHNARMQHPSGIPEKIVNKVVARRGRLHAFEAIDPKATALVVIDLDEATVRNDNACDRMTETVNALADAVRRSGGVVAWVLSRMNEMPRHFSAVLGL